MIVQCAQCAQRYFLDDDVLGSRGCLVRCSQCHNQWRQMPASLRGRWLVRVPSATLPSVVPLEKKPFSLWSYRKWIYGFLALGAMIALLGQRLGRFNFSFGREVYVKLMRGTPPVVLSRVKDCRSPEGTTFLLTVRNPSPQVQKIPVIVLEFFKVPKDPSKPHRKVGEKTLRLKDRLPPESEKDFRFLITDLPKDFSYSSVKLRL